MSNEPPLERATMLEKISLEHAALELLISGLDEEQLSASGVYSGWSVKGCLAHLAEWHRLQVYWLTSALNGEQPELPAPGRTWAEMDAMNAEWYALHQSRPLPEVLADYRAAYLAALAAVRALPAAALTDPAYFAWAGGRPLWPLVAANSFEHEAEFVAAIQHWLAKEHDEHSPF